jgi:hypothetical protein
MNERIWELKRQAMLFAQEKCDGQTTDMHGNLRSNIWTEKFAQLIAKDCAKMLDEDSYIMPELGGYAHDIRTRYGVK